MSVKSTLFVTFLLAMGAAFVGTIIWELLSDLFKGDKHPKKNGHSQDKRGDKK